MTVSKLSLGGVALLGGLMASTAANAFAVGDVITTSTLFTKKIPVSTLTVTAVSANSMTVSINGANVTVTTALGNFNIAAIDSPLIPGDTMSLSVNGVAVIPAKLSNDLSQGDLLSVVEAIFGSSDFLDQQNVSRAITAASIRSTNKVIGNRVTAIGSALRGNTVTGNVSTGENHGNLTSVSAGDNGIKGFGLWINPVYTKTEDTQVGNAFDSKTHAVYMGGDVLFETGTALGVAIGADKTDVTLISSVGTRDERSFTAMLYGAQSITDNLTISGFVGGNKKRLERDDNLGAADFDSTTFLSGITTTLDYNIDQVEMAFAGGLNYSLEKTDGYTTDINVVVGDLESTQSQGVLSAEVGYNIGGATPYLKASYENDFVTDSSDKTGMVGTVGMRFLATENFSGNISYDRVFGRDNLTEHSAQMTLRWSL